MKNLIIAVATVFLLSLAGTAMAAGTNTMTVSASVVGTCQFSAATSTLNFGAMDPALATNATASTNTNFWCTKGVTYTMGDDSGLNELVAGAPRMQHATTLTEYIPYTLGYSGSSPTGSGKSTPITLTVNGTVANADYINAEVGNYSDTVVITVTP